MKRVLLFGDAAALLKAHVDQFTRKDGTVVQAHDTKVVAAMQHPDHKGVVAAASRGEIDLNHAAEKHALKRDVAGSMGVHGPAAAKLLDTMGPEKVAAASRGEVDLNHHAEKVALGKIPPAGAEDITKHPHYHAGDHQWLKDKGASAAEMKAHFDGAPARKAKADARMKARSAAIDSMQSSHAKKTGTALNRQQAASMVASGAAPGSTRKLPPLRDGAKGSETWSGGAPAAKPMLSKPAATNEGRRRAEFAASKAKPAPAALPDDSGPVTHESLKKHPMYSQADHNYLKDKGYSPDGIKALWDRDHKAGHGPQLGNKNAKPGEPGYVRA